MSNLCSNAIYFNGCALVFNFLIPVYPMDGGRFMAGSLILGEMPMKRAATFVLECILLKRLFLKVQLNHSRVSNGWWTVHGSILDSLWNAHDKSCYDYIYYIFNLIVFCCKYIYVMAKSGRADQHPLGSLEY